ncbi:hypothetical protein HUT06_03345 [Actinomadura sp. NAK00032]|uniref:hypothetical protein n=1 Tax=Actinomadura sp. NAK00032 TaxID=2742128 RepID=UPI0015916404|nr:hypothetical protein [Actinomadura sp. NAK00032]QKW33192.1 hypothetical protein HUT06_03345 [Actinomadura sp. NAK00032]
MDAGPHPDPAKAADGKRLEADPAEVTGWINDVKQERARLEREVKAAPRGSRISRDEIADLLQRTGDLARLTINADREDKAGLYRKLGLTMTYYPRKHEVEARVIPEPPHVRSVRVRGATRPDSTWPAHSPLGAPYRILVGA